MNKNLVGTMSHIRRLTLVRTHRALLLVVALVIAVSIQLASPWAAFAQQPFSDLNANALAFYDTSIPSSAISAQATTVQSGTRAWGFILSNRSQTSVTDPTISVQSGYDPSLYNFTWQGQPVTAFPVTAMQSTLGSGQDFSPAPLNSNVPVTFTLGYDSTRTVGPSLVPVGGTDQTVTMTVSLMDSRYAPVPPNIYSGIAIIVSSNLSGVSLVSTTNPNNLNQGEGLFTSTTPSFGLFSWNLVNAQLNKQYTFTAVLNVPNSSGVPFEYRPFVAMSGFRNTVLCPVCFGSSVTVTDATLDGSVPGSGSATFSVMEASHTWTSQHADGYNIFYEGTSQTQVTPVTIEVKPGDGQPAPINPTSQGTIPVAILSTGSFDATTVDPATVKFGATGSEASSTQTSLEDVNGDGKLDMVLHFPTQNTGIVCGTTNVTLTGLTTSGQPISGTVPITTVSC